MDKNEEIEQKSPKKAKKFKIDPRSLCISLTAVILASLVTFMTTYNVMQNAHRREIADLVEQYESKSGGDATLEYMMNIVESYFYGNADDWTLEDDGSDQLYRSYVASLNDPYAAYMSPDEYKEWTDSMSGNLVGIGVMVSYSNIDKTMTIALVFPDSPAQKAGLEVGDIVLSIDGKSLDDMTYNEAVAAMKGEEGTNVSLGIGRGDALLEKELTRAQVETLSVVPRISEIANVGIISILQFDDTTPTQFKSAVDDLTSKGVSGIVFDLRDNPGGDLESVLSALSYILPEGSTLIKMISKDNAVTTRESDDPHTLDIPMAVLINGSTASAAELFTSCLSDYDKVITVGTTSYGKGCMQSLVTLPNGGAFKLTTRMYDPPISESYHGIGIKPDIEIDLSDEYKGKNLLLVDEANDDQLQAALSALLDK